MLTWTLAIDSDDDFDFTDEAPVDLVALESRVGFTDTMQQVALPCTAAFVFDDSSGTFTPEAAGAGDLEVGRFVRLSAVAGSTYTVFTGVVLQLFTDPLTRRVRVAAAGRLAFSDVPVRLPVLQDVRADEVITQALRRARLRQKTGGYLVLNSGRLDQDKLASSYPNVTLASGDSTFAYIALESVSTLAAWLDVAAGSERGLVYEDAAGTIFFKNRSFLAPTPSLAQTFTAVAAVDLQRGAAMANDVTVRVQPVYTVSGELAYEMLAQSIRFNTGEHSRRFRVRDDLGAPLWLLALKQYEFVFADESGVAVQPVNIRVELDGSGFVLHLHNPFLKPIFLTTARLYADTLHREPIVEVQRENRASQNVVGRRALATELPLFYDFDFAGQVAEHILNRRSTLATYTSWFELQGEYATQLGRALWDRVRLTLAASGHDQDYYICGVQHSWRAGVLKTRFYLWPAVHHQYFVLNHSRLDGEEGLGL